MTSLSSTAGVKLARCLAKVPATTWEKVNFQLMSKCPELGAGPLNLNNRNQEAILALGVYFLESGFNHKDKILPYLLDTVKSMGTANFPDELPLDRSSKLPPAENFTFSLITLLNDVASHNPDPGTITTRIMDVQVELLTNILTRLEELRRQDKPASFNTRKMVCKVRIMTSCQNSKECDRIRPLHYTLWASGSEPLIWATNSSEATFFMNRYMQEYPPDKIWAS